MNPTPTVSNVRKLLLVVVTLLIACWAIANWPDLKAGFLGGVKTYTKKP